jgi:hypothetical protein
MVTLGAPPILVVLVLVATGGLALIWVLQNIGLRQNKLQKVALGAGLIAGLIPMGVSSQLGTGIGLLPVLGGDFIPLIFFRDVWRRYRPVAFQKESC